MKYFYLVFLLLTSCSSLDKAKTTFENWQAKLVERKTFQVRNAWVKSTLNEENLRFRKVNRMSPILFTNKDNQDFVIQGNSIDGIASYSRTSGNQVWKLAIANGVEGSAALRKERLYFGGNDGKFYAIDANTGALIWTFVTNIENLAEPLIEDGIIYFQSGSNTLYALYEGNGKEAWHYTRQDLNPLSVRGGSRPSLKNGNLFVGFSDGYLVSLNAKSGQVKWEKQINKNKRFRDIDSNPFTDSDFVYALGYDDKTYCLRQSNGEIVWQIEGGGFGGFLSIGDKLYYSSSNNELVAIDKGSGKKIWSHPISGGIATTPISYKGMVVFGESLGSLKFLDGNSGRLIGSFDPGRGIFSTPTIEDKKSMVYFISGEANLYALEVGFKYPQPINYLR